MCQWFTFDGHIQTYLDCVTNFHYLEAQLQFFMWRTTFICVKALGLDLDLHCHIWRADRI
jgi:hypothetical protein